MSLFILFEKIMYYLCIPIFPIHLKIGSSKSESNRWTRRSQSERRDGLGSNVGHYSCSNVFLGDPIKWAKLEPIPVN